MNFDYYNSLARKNYFAQKNTWPIFLIINIIFFISVISAIVFNFSGFIGLGEIVLAIGLTFECLGLCIRFAKAKNPKSTNTADNLALDIVDLLEKCIQHSKEEKFTEISPELCFDSLADTNFGQIVLMRLGIIFPPRRKLPIKNSGNPTLSPELVSILSQKEVTDLQTLLELLIKQSSAIQKYLSEIKINPDDVKKVLQWAKNIEKASKRQRFWESESFGAGVGEDWAYGYTPVLSLYSTDLSKIFKEWQFQVDIFSHEAKLNEIQNILIKSGKNNCLLVGEPGVGKKTIINALALKISHGESLPRLKYKKIRELSVGQILSGNSQEIAERLNISLAEAVRAGNIILFIDNFQSLIQEENNLSQILIPFLQNSRIQIIASVSLDDYLKLVHPNSAIANAFEKIDILEPSADEALSILLDLTSQVEYANNVFFPILSLKKIVELSVRYIHEVPLPEKAIRLLQEAAVTFSLGKFKIVQPEDIESLISKKVNVPIGQVQSKEKDKLLDLEKFLHQRVVGQDEAIAAVSNTLRRVRAGLTSGKRPAGVFLFLGPTGVGKTETAKALAETYFGSEKRMIRLDMSEYQTPDAIDRLIGTVQNPSGVLTDAVLENPFSLILLDEIEKADKNVLNLFLQVFEDGRLSNAQGKLSDFTNTIIIATSNAGSEFIREKIQLRETENMQNELIDKLQQDKVFAPEFLNRFDGVIVFRPLTPDELTQVASLMIADINKTLEDKKISVEVEDEALVKLIKLGYDPKFGARPMRRVIQEKVENLLAKKMISGEVQENQVYKVTMADIA